MGDMHIVLLSSFSPYPVREGYSQRLWHQARHLAGQHAHVTLVYPDYRNDAPSDRAIGSVRIIGVVPRHRTLGRILFHEPDSASLLPSLISLHRKERIDILEMERPFLYRTARLAGRILGCRLVLAEYLVEYDTAVETDAVSGLSSDRKKIKNMEKNAIGISSRVITCCKRDAYRLCSIYNAEKERFRVIPNGAAPADFRCMAPHNFGKPAVLFVGSGHTYPNRDALWRIVHDIIPVVRERHRNVLFVIAGSSLPEWLSETENLKVIREPEDVIPLMLGASVCIAPLYHGSGTPTKVVEYLAAGRPVVTTTHVAESLGLKNGETAVTADSTVDFADAIAEMLSHQREAARIGKAGQKLAQERYDWNMIAKKLMKVYSEIVRD